MHCVYNTLQPVGPKFYQDFALQQGLSCLKALD